MNKETAKRTLEIFGLLLKRHNVTQERLADWLGIRQQSVGAMLRGKFYPTLDTLYKYLNALNGLSDTRYTLADLDPERYSHTFFMVTPGATPMLVPSLDKIPSDSAFDGLLTLALDGALPKGTYPASNWAWVLVVGGELKVLEAARKSLNH